MIRHRTAPQAREVRKTKTDRDLPSTTLGRDKLFIVKVKIGSRNRYQIRVSNHRGMTVVVYTHKRYGPALHSFNRRVRNYAIKIAMEALGLPFD